MQKSKFQQTFGLRVYPFLALWLIGSQCIAHEDRPPKYPVETTDFVLTVEGDDGKPVPGAEIVLYACRCEEDSGSHYGWPVENIGQPPQAKTDENGKLTFKYARKFGAPPDWLTTSQISMLIQHPEYVRTELHIDPRNGRATQTLVAGCELSFSAQNSAGQAIDRFCVLMGGPGGGAKWLLDEGVKRSRAIPDGSWQTMLVHPSEDGLHLFSGVLPVRLANKQDVSIRKVVLRPGVRLVGALDDTVPRPVKGGQVMAWCLPKPAGNPWADKDPSVAWTDSAQVDENGSFEFSSLPRSGRIQFIALCDGWLIQDAKAEGPRNFVRGITMDVNELTDDAGQPVPVRLPMEQTGSIEVVVHGPDDQPLAGVQVSTWPNQALELSGSQVLGTANRSIERVWAEVDKSRLRPQAEEITRSRDRYQQTTNKEGSVVIRDIPLQRPESLYVAHDDYVMAKKDAENVLRAEPYTCPTAERQRIVIKMEPRPK